MTKVELLAALGDIALLQDVKVEDVEGDGHSGRKGAARRRYHWGGTFVEIDANPSEEHLKHLARHLPVARRRRSKTIARIAAHAASRAKRP